MSLQARPKTKHKISDDHVENQVAEDKIESDKNEEPTATADNCYSDLKDDGKNVELSNSSGLEVSCYRKPDPDDGEIYRAIDVVPTFKFKAVPRVFHNTHEGANNKFKRTLTSPNARKPLGVAVKKPKLDYSSEKEETRIQQRMDSHNGQSSTAFPLANDGCHDDNVHSEFPKCEESETPPALIYGIINDEKSLKSFEEDDDKSLDEEIIDEEESETDKCFTSTGENSSASGMINEPSFSNELAESDDKFQVKGESAIIDEEENKEKYTEEELEFNFQNQFTDDRREEETAIAEECSLDRVSDHSKKVTVHTCLGKNQISFSLTNNGDDFLPANKQLEESKTKSLLKILQQCPDGADLKLSLFMSACSNNIRNLDPFPDKIFEDNDANRHLLYFIAEEIPSVDMIQFYLKEAQTESLRKELLPFIDWLVKSIDPRLELINYQEYNNIIRQVSDQFVPDDKQPTKIFRIKSKRSGPMESSWQEVMRDEETKYAFVSCKVQEAYSILHHGLRNDHCNGSLGPGIYMTDNLVSCLDTCTAAKTWGKSSIATSVKIIFITEFVFNHSVTSYSGKGKPFFKENSNEENSSTKFYQIKKAKLTRLRYLFLYALSPSILPQNPFHYAPLKKKIIKYLNIFRISLLIATVLMGATASKRSVKHPSYLLDTVQHYYVKMSNGLVEWPIWKYVEVPFLAVHISESVPHSCSPL